jgi:hypothetical protein
MVYSEDIKSFPNASGHQRETQAAIDTLPPGRFVPTGMHIGPLCLRPLNQNAVSHTRVPGGLLPANATSSRVRPVLQCPAGHSQAYRTTASGVCSARGIAFIHGISNLSTGAGSSSGFRSTTTSIGCANGTAACARRFALSLV